MKKTKNPYAPVYIKEYRKQKALEAYRKANLYTEPLQTVAQQQIISEKLILFTLLLGGTMLVYGITIYFGGF